MLPALIRLIYLEIAFKSSLGFIKNHMHICLNKR